MSKNFNVNGEETMHTKWNRNYILGNTKGGQSGTYAAQPLQRGLVIRDGVWTSSVSNCRFASPKL